MPRKQYDWGNGSLPEIAPHSLAKHRILREYVSRYVTVLTANPRIDVLRLSLVDGFAGGGEYRYGVSSICVPGSPQILLDAVATAEVAANARRQKPVRVDGRFFFVEKDPTTLAYLQHVLSKRPDWVREKERVIVLSGGFEEHVDEIIAAIKKEGRAHRAIFVLDQYGYTAVPVHLIARIFDALPQAEVFLTLAVGWIADYLPTIGDAVAKLGVPQETIERLRRDGDEVLNIDDPTRRPDLYAVQHLLQRTFTGESGAHFYTPFFIVSRESNRPYWFLHLANNPRANDVVKELHWDVENHFEHFGGTGLAMLGYDPRRDPELIQQLPLFRFDDRARMRMRDELTASLPERIRTAFPDGVTFADLVRSLCNETPATAGHLAEVVRDLCVESELSKRGEQGENRAPATLPQADDVIQIARQQKLFPLGPSRR